MRFDSIGLLWEDQVVERGKRNLVRPMPPIPETGWIAPTEFPNLSRASCIAIDCETYDPELIDCGPGWARGKGHIVGVSIAADNDGRWYFPMRHEIEPETNMNPAKVLEWLKVALGDKNQPKLGANLQYDIGWLQHEGVDVKGELVDVQFAEALLDEASNVALETLGQKYLNEGKESSILYDWCAKFYGGKPNSAQRANIYRTPARLVGPYAESDVDIPMRLAEVMYPLLLKEGLLPVFNMECSLIRLMVAMRNRGVTVDLEKAEQLYETLGRRIELEKEALRAMAGMSVDINSGDNLAKVFTANGIRFPRTAKGKPSFTKDFLGTVDHPIGASIREIRKNEKIRNTFVKSYILDSHVNGKVYCSFHQLRADGTGTRSGRFSSSDPNLQNIPSRDDELAPLTRGLFIPDVGHKQWRKYDYSQIEYRFLIHYAIGPGSDEARQRFNDNPDTDYHEWALDLVAPKAGWDISTKELRKHWRKPVKNINFGLIYAMGVAHLSEVIGLNRVEGKALFSAYHEAVPFAKATMEYASELAQKTGIIETFLGRRSRFDLWEPVNWRRDGEAIGLPYKEAILQYGKVRRAYTHKALNRLLQGSAADLMKAAMLKCWEDGIFDVTGVPTLTVHDELDFSDTGNSDEAFREMQHIMENVLKLRIPVRAEGDIGPDWGHLQALED